MNAHVDEARRYVDLMAPILQKAAEVGPTLDEDMNKVISLVNDHELVWAVWQDVTEQGGVGSLIVKGIAQLEQTASGGEKMQMTWTAIPCNDYEQAEALRLVCGDKAPADEHTLAMRLST